MQKDAKIYVAGHRGLVGSASMGRLATAASGNIATRNITRVLARIKLDLHARLLLGNET